MQKRLLDLPPYPKCKGKFSLKVFKSEIPGSKYEYYEIEWQQP